MYKKTIFSALTALLLVGCGSGGTDSAVASTYSDVTVQRGPVLGAYLVDDSGKRAYNLGNGNYRFHTTPTYPIYAYGGYIDVNRDGVIDSNDTKLNMPLSLYENNNNKLTILTTLAKDDDLKSEILTTYGLSEEELYSLTPQESIYVSAISDEVFKYCIENNTSIEDMNLTLLQSLNLNIQNRIQQNIQLQSQYTTEEIAKLNEISLVNDLNITLDDENITLIQNEITQSTIQYQDPSSILDSFPVYELTQEQKDDLIFMYQEEKVARDVYLNMYDMWGLRVFLNISKAEQIHMDAVKALLEKYQLEVPVLSDTRGEFDLIELKTLYDSLMVQGSVSSNEALKVGVLVEQTDIDDLESKIIDAPDDIKTVFQSLLNGSYNHLNAFSKQVM